VLEAGDSYLTRHVRFAALLLLRCVTLLPRAAAPVPLPYYARTPPLCACLAASNIHNAFRAADAPKVGGLLFASRAFACCRLHRYRGRTV